MPGSAVPNSWHPRRFCVTISAMERPATRNQLALILAIGGLLCSVAISVRVFYRKPVHGMWLGYAYQDLGEGKIVLDKDFGEYILKLNPDGTYEENGNSTSGNWSAKNDRITLIPTRFFDLTPEEHRLKYVNSDGKVSQVIQRLLATRMLPMYVSYSPGNDKLVYHERGIRFEYDRMED